MKTDTTITFAFLGDLMLGGEFIPYVEKQGKDFLSPFTTIESFLSDADIVFVNLEGPIFKGSNKRPGVTSILSNHPSVLDFFARKGMCVLNLANNHIMDYGAEGLKQTIKLLNEKGIYHVGAGENSDEANRELIIECKGKLIAFLAYTSNEPYVGAVLAGSQSAGCASFLDLDTVIDKIKGLKIKVDIICVSLHWGHEYFLFPSYEQIKIAHALVDAGTTYVIGHHPHVVQGIEEYKGSLIVYSLGNFFLPPIRTISGRLQPRKAISKEFMIVKSNHDIFKNIAFNIIGGYVNKDYAITQLVNDNNHNFISKIERLSEPIMSLSYDKFWTNYKANRERELRKESLIEALNKMLNIPLKDLLATITFNDLKRNLIRLFKL